jgi:hypothetical protein
VCGVVNRSSITAPRTNDISAVTISHFVRHLIVTAFRQSSRLIIDRRIERRIVGEKFDISPVSRNQWLKWIVLVGGTLCGSSVGQLQLPEEAERY